jgi:hypothetical protein
LRERSVWDVRIVANRCELTDLRLCQRAVRRISAAAQLKFQCAREPACETQSDFFLAFVLGWHWPFSDQSVVSVRLT